LFTNLKVSENPHVRDFLISSSTLSVCHQIGVIVCSIVNFKNFSTDGSILKCSYGILFKLNSIIFINIGIFELSRVKFIRDDTHILSFIIYQAWSKFFKESKTTARSFHIYSSLSIKPFNLSRINLTQMV
jgi:hypothetical protein